MEVKYRQDLMIECMKTEFEDKVLEKLEKRPSLSELDIWLDPLIRQYFRELDLVVRFYNPEKFEDDEELLLDARHVNSEKSGLINHLEEVTTVDKASDILSGCVSLQEADEELTKLLEERKKRYQEIREFYGIEDET
jgi:hypothetical protein